MMGGLTLVMALTACSHDMPEYKPYDVTDAERVSYAEKILGDIHIDPNQDWSLTKTFKVVVKADAPLKDISKVRVLNGNPFLQSATVLAERPSRTERPKKSASVHRRPTDCSMLRASTVRAKWHR